MLRLHFTAKDLAGVRVAASWGPLSETVFSLGVLEETRPNALLDGWRRGLADRLGPDVHPLLALVQRFAHVDLHTMTGAASSMEEALDALLHARDAHLQEELSYLLPRLTRAPSWTRSWVDDLQRGDAEARRHLVSGLRVYGQRAVEPYWDGIRSHLEVDRAIRGRIMAEGGVEKLLATLHPMIRWQSPVLAIRRPPEQRAGPDVDLRLDGRSLVLVPSVFARYPQVYIDVAGGAGPEVLFYPALTEAEDAMAIWSPEPSGRSALEALLGRTRAMALQTIADTCTTNELARRIGVSPSTASHHASVLRDAGLISTHRNGSAVLHSITVRGALLLDGPPSPAGTAFDQRSESA